ncbi:hypothetical protein K469DRAFT_753251 [Zopfia rhizophila CBS 207.26]|uniref:CFEM domain-containing protein n=1 Tax=Zopfia rhizophila CBS 207.26 TaxID=1314779 RepID=A0A6A6DNB9_9PEZI|nr:hypothetical protein K469DRAFT_753251 [Zopfia rhizophila CBS 207.26]
MFNRSNQSRFLKNSIMHLSFVVILAAIVATTVAQDPAALPQCPLSRDSELLSLPPAPFASLQTFEGHGYLTSPQKDCWNVSAAQAGCDPNVDDECLCGVFFDLVTECVSATCSIPDNLAALDFLDQACP